MGEKQRLTKIPRHVAIIMDGNGRWAQARGLPRLAGHRAGTENIRRILEGCVEYGVKILTIYAFSTENWQRPEEEVQGLMRILEEVIQKEVQELHEKGVRLRHIGRLDGLSPRLQRQIQEAIELTKENSRLILNVAFNYGGRAEILDAVRGLIREGIPAEEIDEELFSRYLYTAGQPDPDLIIRTAGEMRLSNFLLWQSSYAEFYVTDVCWPEFRREQFIEAIR
ncbi:MAG TPA: di-trans,poly-cis-decaprenylcistransferase, partial [Anaerolineae bacterium]|nr:di-trans,poly-cis-decaprenylcistransferase [Anaerolineae bacterium]